MTQRSTDPELLVRLCREHFKQADWGLESNIVGFLAKSHGWTHRRVESALHRALEDESQPLLIGRGGHIVYYGDDRSLYLPVTRGILGSWSRSLGYRSIKVFNTSHCHFGKHNGVWQHPDLIFFADPRRRRSSTAPRETHAVEVEQRRGFNISSIYQAYEHGRGADYSWVFSVGLLQDGWARDRIMIVADELGVGWVEMRKPTAPSTWKIHVKALRRDKLSARRKSATTPHDRDDFLHRNGLKDEVHLLGDRNSVGFDGG